MKQCTNLILHDENYTSFVVSLFIHKMGGGEGGAYFKFWLIGGRLFEGGANLRGKLKENCKLQGTDSVQLQNYFIYKHISIFLSQMGFLCLLSFKYLSQQKIWEYHSDIKFSSFSWGISEWYFPILKRSRCCKRYLNWRVINTVASIWHENVHRYFFLDIICSSKLTVFLRLCSQKMFACSEQRMSADKYLNIFLHQIECIV